MIGRNHELTAEIEREGNRQTSVIEPSSYFSTNSYKHYYDTAHIDPPFMDINRIYFLDRAYTHLYSYHKIEDTIAYFQINNHEEDPDYSVLDFSHDSKRIFRDENVEHIIIDLRQNTGGYPDIFSEWISDLLE
ncbi:S41 family peptidase [Jeotgalibacillus soli]|uniref:S41 family peptidase n=1 Tax=Jeotgalibacillus soli TaxID=889306 RepID=UPI000597A82A|nr:S41 family peptidase [Jeotgalibacillus soli]